MTTKIIAIVLIVISVLTLALPAFATSYVYAKYDNVPIWDNLFAEDPIARELVPFGGRMTVLEFDCADVLYVAYGNCRGFVLAQAVVDEPPVR